MDLIKINGNQWAVAFSLRTIIALRLPIVNDYMQAKVCLASDNMAFAHIPKFRNFIHGAG
jgi:hypothetical protein